MSRWPLDALGYQLAVDFYGCDAAVLDDLERVRAALLEAAQLARATIVGERFHRFAPQGVSGVVIIAESHIAVHTWPVHGYAAIDLFTCGQRLDAERALGALRQRFDAAEVVRREIPRGRKHYAMTQDE